MLHEHGHYHVDQHKLGDQHEGDEVDGRQRRQVAEAVLVLPRALSQRVLGQAAGARLRPPSASARAREGARAEQPHDYLHDPIPVVPSGHSEQCEEGHAEVGEGSMPAQALTGVVLAALCKEESPPVQSTPASVELGQGRQTTSHVGLAGACVHARVEPGAQASVLH